MHKGPVSIFSNPGAWQDAKWINPQVPRVLPEQYWQAASCVGFLLKAVLTSAVVACLATFPHSDPS